MWLIRLRCCRGTSVAADIRSLPRAYLGRVACGSSRWCGLRGEDLRQVVDIDLVEDALAPGLLQAGDELRAQDVDLPVQEPALVRDLVLLLGQIVDQLLEVVVGQRAEIGQRFQLAAFLVEGLRAVKQRPPKGST